MATRNPDVPKAAQIRTARESAGLSQTRSAEIVYVTLRTWQNWEAGKTKMHPILWDCYKGAVKAIKAGVIDEYGNAK